MMLDKLKKLFQREQQHSFKLYKQADGYYRWVGIATNNYLDRDGEIITDEAHRRFAEYLDRHPEYPITKLIWHTDGTASRHGVDWHCYHNGFMMYSGVLELDEAAPYLTAQKEPIGMSHGFIVLGRDPQNPSLITDYMTYEVSDLWLSSAANLLTSFSVPLVVQFANAFVPQPSNQLGDAGWQAQMTG
ncbi:MAG: hypothetical protein E6Q36_05775 [Chryseobacterium sp.]|nr:MAG: hypothetical protein E6Q36_05775 [Chryseobacterium sp.]